MKKKVNLKIAELPPLQKFTLITKMNSLKPFMGNTLV